MEYDFSCLFLFNGAKVNFQLQKFCLHLFVIVGVYLRFDLLRLLRLGAPLDLFGVVPLERCTDRNLISALMGLFGYGWVRKARGTPPITLTIRGRGRAPFIC